ncbi:hypothetical protein V6N13_026942 [Hibiscus sabdariffa]|uniref:Uncharacterized protein n=1 Tax=Hibiscus sabdariffa TaxID=183260 RepID=A0ABR2N9G9_9ROSI
MAATTSSFMVATDTVVLIPHVPTAVKTTRCSVLLSLPPRVSDAPFSSTLIAMSLSTVLSVIMAISFRRLSQQGVITKRMTVIVEMSCMDGLCSDKTGTLTLNKWMDDEEAEQRREGAGTVGLSLSSDQLEYVPAQYM